MKRHNGETIGARAYTTPNLETLGIRSRRSLRSTKSEYTECIEAKFLLRLAQLKEIRNGKVTAHYYAVKEVYGFLEVAGEMTLGGLARELSLEMKIIEKICKHLVDNKRASYSWLTRRKLKTIKIKI